jgi:membrane associated rhomboid family serine protease
MSTNLVLITVGVYLLQLFTQPAQPAGDSGWVTENLSLHADVLKRPWMLFELLSYGFLHSTNDLKHLLFNMIGVWMFGRTIEQRYGRQEFLAFYLVAIVFAGSCWYLAQWFSLGQQSPHVQMLGASGGLSAMLILFVFNFPKQMIYIWGIFPLPAWAFGLFFISQDLMGAVHQTDNVAYTAHLGGALFGMLYYRLGWSLRRWLPGQASQGLSWKKWFGGPKLRVHTPEDSDTDQRVDEILKKIQAHGQASLTWRERRTLEKASQEYQRKQR